MMRLPTNVSPKNIDANNCITSGYDAVIPKTKLASALLIATIYATIAMVAVPEPSIAQNAQAAFISMLCRVTSMYALKSRSSGSARAY